MSVSQETGVGLEMRPIYSENSSLPQYLQSKLLLRELSCLVTGDRHLVLATAPFTPEEARQLQQTWTPAAVFLLTDSVEGERSESDICVSGDLGDGNLSTYYRDLHMLQVSLPRCRSVIVLHLYPHFSGSGFY